jgi:adenylate kinase family enzyme
VGQPDRNWRRVLVTGNSGAGKSVLAERIGATLDLPAHDLDVLLRRPDGRERAAGDAKARVAVVAAGDGWVIEGVFPDLIEVALARATVMVWLDLSWDECRAGLLRRGPHYGMDPLDDDALLAWANAHRARLTEHARLYDGFGGRKVRLRTRREVESFTPLPS